jgi:uncharacterized RDD family membrane protein YckC
MNWHYVEEGQQVGPVTDEQLAQLAQLGSISDNTLVWREGLANWVPYREVQVSTTAPPPEPKLMAPAYSPGGGTVACAECGNFFPVGDTIRQGNIHICAGCKPVFLQKLAEGARFQTQPGELQYARILARFAAVFLDGILLGIVNYTIGFVVGLIFLQAIRSQSSAMIAVQVVVFFINIAVAMTYEGVLIGKYGATVGKMACKIKVVTADGGPVGYGRAFGRYFAKMLSSLTCLIGYIIAIFDSQKRALHDHICNTRVVIK